MERYKKRLYFSFVPTLYYPMITEHVKLLACSWYQVQMKSISHILYLIWYNFRYLVYILYLVPVPPYSTWYQVAIKKKLSILSVISLSLMRTKKTHTGSV